MAATTTDEPICPTCAEQLHAGDRYCEACGAELPIAAPAGPTAACPACGLADQEAGGYCEGCGLRQPEPRDHLEVDLGPLAGVSDRGKEHARNEDAMALHLGAGHAVVVVCDGVSSTVDPQVASAAACDAALDVLREGPFDRPDHAAAFAAARAAVLAVPFASRANLGPPSCTYLAAVATSDVVSIATLGDCRGYWAAEDDVRQLTSDDSWAAEQVRAGRLTSADAMAHPMAHTITRWLAVDADPAWEPAVVEFEFPGRGRIVCCSDGLWNYTPEPTDLLELLGDLTEMPLAAAQRCCEAALVAGGHDNITAVVLDLPLPEGPPAT